MENGTVTAASPKYWLPLRLSFRYSKPSLKKSVGITSSRVEKPFTSST